MVFKQLEERLLGLLLAFQELAVQIGSLFGQPLERDQVFLDCLKGERQAGRRSNDHRRRFVGCLQLAARGGGTIRPVIQSRMGPSLLSRSAS